MKINFLKIKRNFKKKDYTINPIFYWRMILLLGLFILLLSFVFSFRLFMELNKEAEKEVTQINNEIEITKKEKIKEVLKYFIEREKKSQEIINSSSPIIDPSL